MGARVLVVDDEPSIRDVLSLALTARGYDVMTAESGRQALEYLHRAPLDLVILDLMLPDLSGLDILRELRSWSSIPVLVLSVVADASEKVRALDSGADDYLTKAFDMDELVARIRVALRHRNESIRAFRTGGLSIDFDQRRVAVDGREIGLSPTEYEILRALAVDAGKVLTYESLLKAVWGPAYGRERSYLHVFIGRVRRKVEADPSNPTYVLTEPGVGYRLQVHLERLANV